MLATPVKNSYWVVPGKFLAGEYPRELDDAAARRKIDALLAAGITVFIDLTTPADGLKPYAQFLRVDGVAVAHHECFPIPDLSVPASAADMGAILDAIDGHLAAGHGVYVHCWGGVGRTGTVVGCWLARTGAGGEAGLARLRELWRQCPKSSLRRSPETHEQEQFVRNWRTGQ